MLRLVYLLAVAVVVTNAYRRVCYHSNWSQYRPSPGKFLPENINASLCTHVIYAFAKLNGNHLKAFEWNDESTPWSKGMYERFNAMKTQNPSVKTMLAVGGWNMGSAPFTRIAASDASRQDFATDAAKFLRSHNFDGLDFDWEYPANRGSPPQDKQNFVLLVKKTRETFDAEAQQSGKPRLLLSAATGAGKEKIESAYDLPQLVKYLDMINLMTYDLHGSFEDHTGHNSPLKAGPMDTGNDTYLNTEWPALEYVRRGVPKSMLNIGMPLYGRSFTLKDRNNNGLNAPIRGGGNAGMYTREQGFLAYYEICKMIPSATKHIIQGEEVPYIVKGDQWVGYDDKESLRKKVDFVKQQQFGGVMVWDLALDDFTGLCGDGKYPLLTEINRELRSATPPNALATTQSHVNTQSPAVTQAPVNTQQPAVTQAPVNTQSPAATQSNGYRRVCYHSNWSQYRPSPGKFLPENINASLCTHVIYAFAKLNGNHLKAFEWNDESTPWSKGMYERFNAMKTQNPSVKTMLAVGGWNMGSAPFTRIAASDASRQDFATDAAKFLRSHNFDGLDFDWEYPANRGSPPQDKQNFVLLVKKTRETFDTEAQQSGKPRLILSAATGAGKEKIESAYDLPQLVKYLDMINLMTYDLHGSFEDHTGHNSPLKAGPMDTGNDTYLNTEWPALEYVRRGVPKSMLNIGMPLYGRSFTLKDRNNNGLNAPIRGGGNAGMYTREQGFLAYYEICKMIPSATKHIIQGEEVPYIVKGDQWVGYDDKESLRKKVDFVKQQQFGGVMVWDLALDDFTGLCGDGKYPLLTEINRELRSATPPNALATTQSSVTQAPVNTQQPAVTQAPVNTQSPAVTQSNGYRRVCYHSNWSQYRPSPGKFLPENIDASLCTHVIYAFAKLNGNHLKAFEWNDESTPWSKGMYERFNAMKTQNPSVKTMLAVGGWNMGSAPFTRIAASDASRQDFATDAAKFLRSHNFDGLDFDWEYPANRGSPPQDKQNFVLLVKKTRETFDAEAQQSGKPRLILSAATGAGKEKIESAYDLPQLVKYLDMINLMTYDLHGSFEDHTGHNSPLKAGPMDTGNDTYLNTEWPALEYVRRGVPKSMLNIGMPLYGRSFTLKDRNNNGLNAPIRGGGNAGRYTREQGFLAYYEICKMIPSATKHIIQGEEVPYIVQGDQWVGYDDKESLRKKVDFVKQEHFGGVMVWDLALDDFTGLCGDGKYPLLTEINRELRSGPTGAVTIPPNAPTTTPALVNTQPSVVTQAPVITQAPVMTQAPVITQAPVVTQAPVNTQPPVMTQAPVNTQPPVMTQAPVNTQPPVMTQAPVNTQPPVMTQAPVITQAPVVTQAPVNTQPPVITQAPVNSQPPVMTQAPVNTQPPVMTQAPVNTQPPVMTQAPVNTQPPVMTQAPVNTQAPVMTQAPVNTQPPVMTQAPVNTQPPVMTQAPVNTQAPVMTQAPVNTQPPVMTQAPVNTQPPVMTQAPVNTQPPVMTQAPVNTQPSVMTQAPVNTQPPVMTQAPVNTQPPVMTQAPVNTQPPVITQAPVNTQPPVMTQPPATNAPVTSAPSTSAPSAQHTMSTTNHFNCASQTTGFYPSPNDCSKYFICAGGSAFEVACTSGLHFNPTTLFCDWPQKANCNGPAQSGSTPLPTNAPTPGVQPTNAPLTNAPLTNAPLTNAPLTNAPLTNAPAPSTAAPTQAPQWTNPTQQPKPPAKFCSGKNDGIHADLNDCNYFYECASGLQFHERCSPGTVFNDHSLNCDYPQHVPRCSGSGK